MDKKIDILVTATALYCSIVALVVHIRWLKLTWKKFTSVS